jgi:hypothetical protein
MNEVDDLAGSPGRGLETSRRREGLMGFRGWRPGECDFLSSSAALCPGRGGFFHADFSGAPPSTEYSSVGQGAAGGGNPAAQAG